MRGVLIIGLLLGQSVPAELVDSAGLERIRKSLERPPALQTTLAGDRGALPVFRLTVHGARPDSPPWGDQATLPSYNPAVQPALPP